MWDINKCDDFVKVGVNELLCSVDRVCVLVVNVMCMKQKLLYYFNSFIIFNKSMQIKSIAVNQDKNEFLQHKH